MVTKLPLIHSFEVARHALCLNRVDNWCALLNSFGCVSIDETEVLESLRISRLEVKVSGDVATELEVVSLCFVFE